VTERVSAFCSFALGSLPGKLFLHLFLSSYTGPPTSVDILGDWLYVVQGNKVYQTLKYTQNKDKMQVIHVSDVAMHDLLINQKSKQPTGKSIY
jgi:hypothetical protein